MEIFAALRAAFYCFFCYFLIHITLSNQGLFMSYHQSTVSPILRGTRKQTLDPSNEASFQYFDGLFVQDTKNYYSAFRKMQHFENRTIFGWVIAILSCWVWEKQICWILPMEKKSCRFLAIFLPIFRKLAISQPNSIRFPKTRIHLKAGY